MDTYLMPVMDDELYIDSVQAYSFDNAKEKFMTKLGQRLKLDVDDWDSFLDSLSNIDVYVGEIYLKDEF